MTAYRPDIVFHHMPCDDGLASAAVIANYYSSKQQPDEEEIKFLHWNYQKPYAISELIDMCRGKHVLLVDCSTTKENLEKLAQSTESILIIDHHVTAKRDLVEFIMDGDVTNIADKLAENKILMIYDVNHSGASMAYRFFYPNTTVPAFIDYIENIDLGKEDLPNAGFFKYWNRSNKLDIDIMQGNVRMLTSIGTLQHVFESGKEIKRYADNVIEQTIRNHRIGTFAGKQFPFLFSIYELSSDTANAMISPKFGDYDFAMMFYFTANGIGASIRSVPDFDCSVIAKHFGGGGHAQAAGFNIPWERFGWFYNEMQEAGTDLFSQQ